MHLGGCAVVVFEHHGGQAMKTVLAPGAPWPKQPEEKVKVKRAPRPPKKRSTKQKTDEMFALWAAKNIGSLQ